MSLSTREGLSPIEVLELDMQLDEEQECEHYGHHQADQLQFHGGPGEWYIQFKCPECGATDDVMLICTVFKEGCLKYGIWCEDCETELEPGEGFLFVERK